MLYPNCVVIPEYTKQKPTGWKCSEDLIHFDLLIRDHENDEQILIEFKYKTKSGSFNIGNGTYVELREQSDSTNGRYAIWRDIYRIETFANLNDIDKGFIVFITNNKTYYAIPGKGTLAEQFSISHGLHTAGDKYWNTNDVKNCQSIHFEYRSDVQPLQIENDYFFGYEEYSEAVDLSGKKHRFDQLILPIYSSSYAEKIETELVKLGKSVFVKYYDAFKTGDSELCKRELAKEAYTANSISTRVSCGLRMFKENRNIEALRHIIASSKMEETIRSSAEVLLKKELS